MSYFHMPPDIIWEITYTTLRFTQADTLTTQDMKSIRSSGLTIRVIAILI